MDNNNTAIMSAGGINVTSLENGIVTGTFLMGPAGYGAGHKQTSKIEGRFPVPLGW